MPLQISDLGKERRTFTWEYLGEEVNVTYNIYQFTPEMEDDILSRRDDDEMAGLLVDNLLSIVIDWDVMDGDHKVPLTKEGLSIVPIRLMSDLMQAIGEDAGGDDEEGKASGGQSRSRPNREQRRRSRRGTTSSSQQGSFG